MGIIRGALVFFIGILLIIALVISNLFLAITMSLSYDNVNNNFRVPLDDINNDSVGVSQRIINQYGLMLESCNSTLEIKNETGDINIINTTHYTFLSSELDSSFEISCETVSNGEQATYDFVMNEFINNSYYYPYDCRFFDCFEKNQVPLFLISKKSHDYFNGKFRYMLIVSIIFAVLLFIFISNKKNFFFVIGSIIILSALPLVKVRLFLTFILKLFFRIMIGGSKSPEISLFINNIYTVFFSEATRLFWILMFIGVVLIVVGFVLRIVGWSLFLSKFFGYGREKKVVEKKRKVKENKNESSSN